MAPCFVITDLVAGSTRVSFWTNRHLTSHANSFAAFQERSSCRSCMRAVLVWMSTRSRLWLLCRLLSCRWHADHPRPHVRHDDRRLLDLVAWLLSLEVTHVAMESTGEFWKPVYNLLEGQFTVLVVNAAHIKYVPGRKTDVKDAEWIAELLAHGLLRPSFVPPAPQRALRDLTRQRTHLIQERASVVNRMQKVLEWANIKLASVVTDITGVSARAMLEALVAGQTDVTRAGAPGQGSLAHQAGRAGAGVARHAGATPRLYAGAASGVDGCVRRADRGL